MASPIRQEIRSARLTARSLRMAGSPPRRRPPSKALPRPANCSPQSPARRPPPQRTACSTSGTATDCASPTGRPTRRTGSPRPMAAIKSRSRAFCNKISYVQGASPASASVTPPGYFALGSAWVAGTAAVGYTVSDRTSRMAPSPSAGLYQWLRDGKPITGATGATYQLTAADQWHRITFRVTFMRAGTVNATMTSRVIRPLAAFTKLPTLVVRGTCAAGKTLTATTAPPSPAPAAITWQRLCDERPIPWRQGSQLPADAERPGQVRPGGGDIQGAQLPEHHPVLGHAMGSRAFLGLAPLTRSSVTRSQVS